MIYTIILKNYSNSANTISVDNTATASFSVEGESEQQSATGSTDSTQNNISAIIMKLHQKLTQLQKTLKAPKNLYNSFGKYKYRNAESILEAVKAILPEDLSLQISTDIVQVGSVNNNYIKVTVTLTDGENSISSQSFAREAADKKGMDDSQITGATESYAKKYALSNMFLLDDTKDADSDEYTAKTTGKEMPEKKEEVKASATAQQAPKQEVKTEEPLPSFASRRRPVKKLEVEEEDL